MPNHAYTRTHPTGSQHHKLNITVHVATNNCQHVSTSPIHKQTKKHDINEVCCLLCIDLKSGLLAWTLAQQTAMHATFKLQNQPM